jgi:hypothetical protein
MHSVETLGEKGDMSLSTLLLQVARQGDLYVASE